MKKIIAVSIFSITIIIGWLGYRYYQKTLGEVKILKEVISRLEADSRVAEVLVTGVKPGKVPNRPQTTIKFLEYDVDGEPLPPRYFTFSGNIIQFQSLVIRFDDIHIRQGDSLRGRSAYLFWKVFMLDGKNTEEFELAAVHQIPGGYKLSEVSHPYEEQLWRSFWDYALIPQNSKRMGIKNVQIEAPGSLFIPGILYSIKIEHDGGLRIDTQSISPIMRGETIP